MKAIITEAAGILAGFALLLAASAAAVIGLAVAGWLVSAIF